MQNECPPFSAPPTPHIWFSVAKRLAKLRRRPIETKRLGANWQLHANDWIDNRLIIGRPFEFKQLNFAFKLIKDNELTVFLDCGSNIGLYSILIGVHAETITQIHAFEPVPHTFERLRKNIELNELQDVANLQCCALGDHSGTLNIHIQRGSSGVATLNKTIASTYGRKFDELVPVKIEQVDTLTDLDGERIFVKIDVEGHTLELLAGMTRTLKSNKAIIQVESAHNDADVTEFLDTMGYKIFKKIGPDFYFTNIDNVKF